MDEGERDNVSVKWSMVAGWLCEFARFESLPFPLIILASSPKNLSFIFCTRETSLPRYDTYSCIRIYCQFATK